MKLVIASGFTEGRGFAPFLTSLVDTMRMLDKAGIEADFWSTSGAAYVDDMRNWFASKFLDETDATHFVMLDYDMEWRPEGFTRLLTADMPVVGGSYRAKNMWMRWTAVPKHDADGDVVGIPRKDGQGFLIEAEGLAMGFTCIKREVLEAVRDAAPDDWYIQGEKKTYDLFTRIREGRNHWGEDYAFCNRWKALGGQLWIDPNITLTHHGLHGWRGNLHEFWQEKQKMSDELGVPLAAD